MHDHFLAQRGEDNLGQTSEGREDALSDELAKGVKQELLSHQRYAPSNYDPSGAQKGDNVANGFR